MPHFWLGNELGLLGTLLDVIKVRFIGLVNLIMDREVIKELIQEHFTKENIITELNKLIEGSYREQVLSDYEELHQKLGGTGASKRAAQLMVKYLSNS